MSRQFDEYMEGTFEVYGETYRFVEPTNIDELAKALEIRNVIQDRLNACMHDDDDISAWETALAEQDGYIQGYVENLGEYDNTIFADNLNFLLKKYGIRIGTLENLLNLSAGYISRTIKEGSQKKLSIDVVWKISQFFGVDLDPLLFSELEKPDMNVELIARFLEKLYKNTLTYEIEWENEGGCVIELAPEIEKLNMLTENNDEEKCDGAPIYHPGGLNPKTDFYMVGDIYSCSGVIPEAKLIIVPFAMDMPGRMDYEFLLVSKDENGAVTKKQMFNTAAGLLGSLQEDADRLYGTINENMLDTPLSKEMKSVISDYLKA